MDDDPTDSGQGSRPPPEHLLLKIILTTPYGVKEIDCEAPWCQGQSSTGAVATLSNSPPSLKDPVPRSATAQDQLPAEQPEKVVATVSPEQDQLPTEQPEKVVTTDSPEQDQLPTEQPEKVVTTDSPEQDQLPAEQPEKAVATDSPEPPTVDDHIQSPSKLQLGHHVQICKQMGPSDSSDGLRAEAASSAGRTPSIRQDGPSNEVLFSCPESHPLDYETVWYRLPDIPDFLICSRCYTDHIERSVLSKAFVKFHQRNGVPSKCRFWVPRITRVLWPQAVKTNSLSNLREFMARRTQIADCDGYLKVGFAANWYMPPYSKLNQLSSCEACYEDTVLSSPMSRLFIQDEERREHDGPQACHIALQCISKILQWAENYLYYFDFNWIAGRRIGVGTCGEGRTWYRPQRQIPGLYVCEPCFLDKIAITPYQTEFEQVDAEQSDTEVQSHSEERKSCSLSPGPIAIAWDSSVSRGDYEMFWNAAKTVLESPACNPEGITDGVWYTIQGVDVGLNICPACYAGIMGPLELGQFFSLAHHDKGARILCDLNPAAPRCPSFARKLSQTVQLGDFRIFSNHVQRLTRIPLCPRREALQNATWCYIGGCPICPECYDIVVADTALGQRLPVSRSSSSSSTLCSMYSLSMRRKWAEACARDSIDDFVVAARRRADIYFETVPVIDRIEQRFVQPIEDVTEDDVDDDDDGGVLSVPYHATELYGNVEVGWHQTRHGAQSARLTKRVRKKIADAQLMDDDWLLLDTLEKKWAQVE